MIYELVLDSANQHRKGPAVCIIYVTHRPIYLAGPQSDRIRNFCIKFNQSVDGPRFLKLRPIWIAIRTPLQVVAVGTVLSW